MPKGKPGDASFSRRKPKLRRGPGRPGVPFRPIEGGGETVDYGKAPLFGIFRDGRRVYLPPAHAPGVPEDEANRMAENVGGEVIELWNPEDAA